jgi:hypothetical protein
MFQEISATFSKPSTSAKPHPARKMEISWLIN